MILTTAGNLGFPRMGRHRELKFALEKYWNGETDEATLLGVAQRLRRDHWQLQVACAHPSRLDGERDPLLIPDLTGCLSNCWQRHFAYGCGPARFPFDHCMRRLRFEATTSGTRKRHPTHSSLNPVRMNYCRRSQREQVLMEWT
jgi:hypothetical protein